jgi:hypothetical protein
MQQTLRLPGFSHRLCVYLLRERNYNPERQQIIVLLRRATDQRCAIGRGHYYEGSGAAHIRWKNGEWTYYHGWAEFTEATMRWFRERDSAIPCSGVALAREEVAA